MLKNDGKENARKTSKRQSHIRQSRRQHEKRRRHSSSPEKKRRGSHDHGSRIASTGSISAVEKPSLSTALARSRRRPSIEKYATSARPSTSQGFHSRHHIKSKQALQSPPKKLPAITSPNSGKLPNLIKKTTSKYEIPLSPIENKTDVDSNPYAWRSDETFDDSVNPYSHVKTKIADDDVNHVKQKREIYSVDEKQQERQTTRRRHHLARDETDESLEFEIPTDRSRDEELMEYLANLKMEYKASHVKDHKLWTQILRMENVISKRSGIPIQKTRRPSVAPEFIVDVTSTWKNAGVKWLDKRISRFEADYTKRNKFGSRALGNREFFGSCCIIS